MATKAVVLTGTLPTTNTAYVDFTSSGFGTPDAAIIIVGNGDTGSNPQASFVASLGIWTATTQAYAAASAIDAEASSLSGRKTGTGSVVYCVGVSSGPNYSTLTACSAASITDGIRITKNSGSSSAARYVTVILLGGLTNEYVGSVNLGTGTSAINVTAPGFRADLVFAIGIANGNDTATSNAILTLGAAQINASDVVSQGVVSVSDNTAQTTTQACTMVRDDAVACQNFNDTLTWKASIGAHASGFTITPSANANSDLVYYLALELADPDDAYVAIKDTITGTGNQAYTGAGFTPQAIILSSTLATATNTNTTSGAFSIGAGGPASTERCISLIDEDAQADSDAESYADLTNILRILDAVGSTDTIASLSSLDADGWTLNYSDGSASARKMLAIAIGNSSAGGTTVTPDSGAITTTGYAPTISQPQTVSPAAGAVSALGYAPSLIQGVSVSPGAGAATYTGLTPTISQPHTVAPSAGAATILGYAPSIQQAAGIYPGAGAVEYAGQTPTISQPHTVSPGVGAYDILGYAPTVSQAVDIAPLAGSIIILGYAPAISQPITVAPGAGAAAWLGQPPTISQSTPLFTQEQLDYLLAYMEANMAVPTAAQIAAAVWAEVLEGTLTAADMQRIKLAALAGKRQGLGTATEEYLGLDGVTPRVTFTPADASGNGTTVVDGA